MRLTSILEDGDNHSISSRRVVTLLAFVLCSIAFLANLFWGFKIDQFIYESMMYIVLGGLGVIVAEKFTKKSKE
jgi:hypothetical protein